MRLTEKEELLIKEGKLKAVLRWKKPDEKIGDIIFSVGSVPFRLVDRKKWKLFRIAAQRSHIDFSCDSIYNFKVLIGDIYKPYHKIKDDTVFLCMIKAEKSQTTLGL